MKTLVKIVIPRIKRPMSHKDIVTSINDNPRDRSRQLRSRSFI